MKIEGKAWKFGDNVDTDQIIPAKYLITGDLKELAAHAFENVRPEFVDEVKKGDMIVAENNFGCGSSREHAPRALIGAGISCVIAKSFARIFYRNSINIGLPLIETDIPCEEGDIFEVDFDEGIVKNKTKGATASFPPMPEFLREMSKAGGLVEYSKRKLG